MSLIAAGAVAGAVYFLAKGSKALPSAAPPTTDVKATLGGNDGASSTDGRALSAFPAVGDGSPAGSVQTAPAPLSRVQNFTPASGGTLTTEFKAVGGSCGTCYETQVELQAAIGSVAPGVVF